MSTLIVSKLTVWLFAQRRLGCDAEKTGIGAADIAKLKLNGYYTVAVMTYPELSARLCAAEHTNLEAVGAFCDSQNTSESQGL